MITTKVSVDLQKSLTNTKATHFQDTFDKYSNNSVPIAPLGKKKFEVLSFPRSLQSTNYEDYTISECEDYVFMRFVFDEAKYNGLTNATFKIYELIFAELNKRQLNFLRAWNFIPNILDYEELERYRLFNKGRWEAWQQFGPLDELGDPIRPATTVIGALDGPFIVEVLFTKYEVIHLENPRQKQFIHYSKKWGPKPPISARGTLHRLPNYEEVYISGTASLVGEEVAHEGDSVKQTEETLENIRVLLSDANLGKYNATSSFKLSDLTSIRVYIKHKKDYPAIRQVVENHVVSTEVLYLHDDICRPGFLVEIEGVARKSLSVKNHVLLKSEYVLEN